MTITFPAFAQGTRVEDITATIYKDLTNNKFKSVEEHLNTYIAQDLLTRHGTDLFLDVIDGIIDTIEKEKAHDAWSTIETNWFKKSPNSFAQEFFRQRFKHAEALYFTQDTRSENLLQSQRRRYKETMGNSYNRYLKLSQEHPDEWRTHAYLAHNYKRYKLTAKELNEHFIEAQRLKKGEVSSMQGYIAALSPYELGRDDKMIEAGIASILQKYPDRNLTKPEYIDATIKQEIEDKIFEISIGRMLITARKYVENADKESYAPTLIPMTYEAIYKDLKKHYADRPEKIEQHSLSLKRPAVWNEVKSNYSQLLKRYPSSGKYLIEYLKLSLEHGQSDKIKALIQDIENNDPNYRPADLAPVQCDYYSSLQNDKSNDNSKNNSALQMYNACKKAAFYKDNETYIYRTGWAARQLKNYDESNEYLERAVKLAPNNPAYLTDLCWNYKDLKDFGKALDYCDKAITVDRKHARAWLGRSHINYYGFDNLALSQKDAQMYKQLTQQK